jgi:CRISPR-associated exonuclease Cas4
LQRAAYALLREEAWGIPVSQGYLYSIPLKQVEAVPITLHLRKKVVQTVHAIKQAMDGENIPAAPSSLYRCAVCECRRVCNDRV